MSRDEVSPWGEVRAVTTNGVTLDTAFAGPDDDTRPDDDTSMGSGSEGAQANTDTPILLLHGFPESREQWRPIVPALTAAGHRVIAPNLRGYSPGARPEGAENYAISHLVDDVIGLLDAPGLERVYLVGHDWGGIVAWFAAVRHPIRFASLTAVSTAHPHAVADALATDPEQRDAMQYIKHLRAPGAEDNLRDDDWFKLRRLAADLPPEQLAHHLELLAQPGALTGALNYYRAFDPRDGADLGPCTVPTTYVWGTDDPAFRLTCAERTADHVTAPYRFVRFDGVGHWISEHAPDDLTAAILGQVHHSV